MRALWVGVFVLAACGTEPVGRSVAAISGGAASDRDAVVFVFATTGTTCSGTVIGPRHVLTARLCVFHDDRALDASELRVVTGPSSMSPEGAFDASASFFDETATEPPGTVGQNDLALIVTSEELGITPIELGTVAAAVDDMVTLAGYGTDGASSSGTRLEAVARVDAVMTDVFSTAGGPVVACSGDAGGPALNTAGELVGVPLFIFDPDGGMPMCGTAATGIRDVITYRDVITG